MYICRFKPWNRLNLDILRRHLILIKLKRGRRKHDLKISFFLFFSKASDLRARARGKMGWDTESNQSSVHWKGWTGENSGGGVFLGVVIAYVVRLTFMKADRYQIWRFAVAAKNARWTSLWVDKRNLRATIWNLRFAACSPFRYVFGRKYHHEKQRRFITKEKGKLFSGIKRSPSPL